MSLEVLRELVFREKFSRVFVVFSNTAATAPVFTVSTLATLGGRMDVVARSLINALWDLESQRFNTLLVALLNGPPNPPLGLYAWRVPAGGKRSEGFFGGLILEALSGKKVDGLLVEKGARLVDVVSLLKGAGYPVYLLDENGLSYANVNLEEPVAFVLGDHIGIPADLLRQVTRLVDGVISIGRTPYLTSHCIAFVHELLDRSLRLRRQ